MPVSLRIILLAALLVPARVYAQPCDCKQYTGVIILHAGGFARDTGMLGKLAFLADSLSKEFPYVFIVSPGDNFTSTTPGDTLSSGSSRLIGLMNRCGFKACAVGKQESELGTGPWKELIADARFPLVSCNFTPPLPAGKNITPYTVLRAGKGNRILLMGLTQTGHDPAARVREFRSLKKQFPIIIALGRMSQENAKKLYRGVPELDDIIGVNPGPGTDSIGKTTLVLNQGKIMERRDEVIPVSALSRSDPKVQRMYNNPEPGKL